MSGQKGKKMASTHNTMCFQLHSTSPKAYQLLKDSGVLELPDKRTLRDYSGCFKAGFGIDSNYLDLVKKDFLARSNAKNCDGWVGIVHDEVSLRQELVFDDTGKVVDFVDLGSTQNSIDSLEYSLSNEGDKSFSPDEATHMCVFMIISPFSFSSLLLLNLLHYLIFFGNVLRN